MLQAKTSENAEIGTELEHIDWFFCQDEAGFEFASRIKDKHTKMLEFIFFVLRIIHKLVAYLFKTFKGTFPKPPTGLPRTPSSNSSSARRSSSARWSSFP